MSGIVRFLVGLAGGFAAAPSKVLAIDAAQLAKFLDQGNIAATDELRGTIFIVTPILMILGGLVGWASSERNRFKLLAIGCSAPALVAPWTAQPPKDVATALLSPISISSAYAQTPLQTSDQPAIVKGLQVLFGVASPETQRYWVIVSSDRDLNSAKAFADTINAAAPTLQAFVGQRQPGNDNYPIIVGGPTAFLPLDQAQALQQKAATLSIVPGNAYLSSYPDRLPSPVSQ